MTWVQLIPTTQAGRTGGVKPEPAAATLSAAGLLSLNTAAVELLGRPERILVFHDQDTWQIRLQPTTPHGARTANSPHIRSARGCFGPRRTHVWRVINDRRAVHPVEAANEEIKMAKEWLTVVEIKDVNDYYDIRLSRIGDDWFVYRMNFHTGEVRNGNESSYQTAGGIRYLYGRGMSEGEARNLFEKTNA